MMRVLWFAMIIALALVAMGAQIDRQSRYAPDWSSYVPSGFSFFAARNRTQAAVTIGDGATALPHASALVARRPMSAENLRLLAQAQALARAERDALVTIQHAGRRGWRDPIVQQAMLEIAVAANDDKEAARRVAALWARNPDPIALAPLANRALEAEAAQDEIVRLLREEPRWLPAFERMAPDILDPAIRDDIERRRKAADLDMTST